MLVCHRTALFARASGNSDRNPQICGRTKKTKARRQYKMCWTFNCSMDSPLRVYTVYLERARIFLRLRFNLRIRFLRHCKDGTRENGLDTAIEVMLGWKFSIRFSQWKLAENLGTALGNNFEQERESIDAGFITIKRHQRFFNTCWSSRRRTLSSISRWNNHFVALKTTPIDAQFTQLGE